MSIQAISTKIISTLGNKESLIPIMIKDGVDSASLTCKSFKEGGPVEGMDRFIDEFGTQAIWIGGIPLYKKIIDNTIYKAAKLNPNVDPRIIANKEYSNWAVENAKGFMSKKGGQTVKEALTDSLKDGGKLAKNLYTSKIIAATALTLGTFFLLTKTKQNNTKKTVINDMKTQMDSNITSFSGLKVGESEVFADINNLTKTNKPSFKGGIVQKAVEGIMFNPVHNMKIIDAGITTERLACSRNATEFCEHAIKEGGFLFFIYGFGNLIENGINKLSSKILNKPIDLGIDVLMDDKFASALQKGSILDDIAKMPAKDKSLTDKLNFIVQNPDNIVVQAAKKSKLVSTAVDAAGNKVVDTSKFIDTKAIEQLAEQLKHIDSTFKTSGQDVKKYLKKSQWLKVGSVAANIGISCLFLGYLIPKLVYAFREKKTGSTKFHVAEDIKNNNKKDLV